MDLAEEVQQAALFHILRAFFGNGIATTQG